MLLVAGPSTRTDEALDLPPPAHADASIRGYVAYAIVADELQAWENVGLSGAIACDVPAQRTSRYVLPCCSEYEMRSGARGVSCLPGPGVRLRGAPSVDLQR
jgi:hypothetical protein